MVGVPGRSKACSTCRKRRKGCDQQRPACGQCVRAKLPCGGYERSRVFVQVNPDAGCGGMVKQQSSSPPSPANIVLQETLARSTFEAAHLAEFWNAYLPHSPSRAGRLVTADWIGAVQQLHVSDQPLHKALLAISLDTMGKAAGQRWMVEEGLKQHIATVKLMGHALSASTAAQGEAIFATARLISLFVILQGSDSKVAKVQQKTWQRLLLGEMALIVARKPEAFTTGHAHKLFRETRQQLAIISLSARKELAINSEEWKTKPWSKIPKTSGDYLTDIILDIPILQELIEEWIPCRDPERKEWLRQAILDGAWQRDGRLRDWSRDHCPIGSGYDPPSAAMIDKIRNDLGLAYTMSHFWGACLIVGSMIRSVSDPAEPLPERTEMMRYIRFLIMIIPGFYKPHAGVAGSHLVTFSVSTSLNFLETLPHGQDTREFAELRKFLSTFGFLKRGYGAHNMAPMLRMCFEHLADTERQRQAHFGVLLDAEEASETGIMEFMGV